MGHKPFVQDKAPSHRPARIAQAIKEELSTLVNDLKDPRLADSGFITITSVEVMPDFRNASVRFALMGEDENWKDIEAALNHSAGFLRRELRSRLGAKVTPELSFKFDKGLSNVSHIDGLLKNIEHPDDNE